MKKNSPFPVRSTAELAGRLGLSRWTVSRALNGHSGIRAETVARVLAAARECRFEPNVFGLGLRSGKMKWVGVGLPDLVDYALTNKLSRLQRAVSDLGLRVQFQIMEQTPEGERAVIERFVAMRCTGIVLIASDLAPADHALAAVREAGIRLVRIDPTLPGADLEVSTDRAHAMRVAVRRLNELGHRRIAVAGVDPSGGYGRQRIAGFRRGCTDCGWNFERDVQFLNADGADYFRMGAALAARFLELPRWRFTAVVALNDRIALGLVQALSSAGLNVPDDLSMLGYDDSDFAAYVNPPLSTINPRVEDLIAGAVSLLYAPEVSRKHLSVKPTLVERGSLSRPKRMKES